MTEMSVDEMKAEIELSEDIIEAYRTQVKELRKRNSELIDNILDMEEIAKDRYCRMQQEIEELRDGTCRFHCRTVRQAFRAGYFADLQHFEEDDEGVKQAEEIAYLAWRGE